MSISNLSKADIFIIWVHLFTNKEKNYKQTNILFIR